MHPERRGISAQAFALMLLSLYVCIINEADLSKLTSLDEEAWFKTGIGVVMYVILVFGPITEKHDLDQ